MKRYSTSLVIKKVQIKIKMKRYHCTLNKTANIKKTDIGTSRVVQWLRIHLPIQGTQVQTLVGELRSHRPWGN